jgi:hypothetical protein
MDFPSVQSKEVKCLDLYPTEDIRRGIHDYKKQKEAEQMKFCGQIMMTSNDVKVNEPTVLGRAREMGISFLKPEDFQKDCLNSRVSEEVKDYALMWYPKAAEPSLLSKPQRTSNESLLLNSAALKYLSD